MDPSRAASAYPFARRGFDPPLKADTWNKLTYVTFSGPVEIPGRVLPAYYPQGLRPCFREHRAGPRSSNWGAADKARVQRFTGYPVSVIDFGRDREKVRPT